MGKNRLVYGENTEISYLVKIMNVFMVICGCIGVLLTALGEYIFGIIAFLAILIMIFVVIKELKKQYQKIDVSFLYEGKEVAVHIDIYGKTRTKKPVVLKYGEEEISVASIEGAKFAKNLTFMLQENLPCVFTIQRKKKAVTVTIGEKTVIDNNYVRKEYLLPNES